MTSSSKNYLKLLAGLVIVGALLWFGRGYLSKPSIEEKTETPLTDLYQVVDVSKLPEGLPTNLPIEKNAPVVKNDLSYSARTNEITATRSYYSDLSIAKNQTNFTSYFQKESWQILSSLNEPQFAFIVASKEGVSGVLQVTVSLDAASNKVLVEISKINKNPF